MTTKPILEILIASILAISVVLASTLPEAFAKKDFTVKPDFVG